MTNPNSARKRIYLALALALLLGGSIHRAQGLTALQDAQALDDFNSRIRAYISIHHQAEQESGLAPDPKMLESAKEIADRKRTMAKHIAMLRTKAHEGDIFTPELKAYFARALDSAYQTNPQAFSAALACVPKTAEQTVVVNAVYPEHLGYSVMTATMLRHLPALPQELEYRIVNRDLIIRDREANLIIDVMRTAVASSPEGADCND
jgi:hypothetical protein